ncbi:MAG: putative toxin-antitoxin system toxin component, PIN family [Nitrospirae bacterium]|nr:putative toxin-antitoxin system toxin component, PIN family [Nitrospirota bacterium]
MKVVFDTNIYISAFITPGGHGEIAYQKAIDGEIQLFSSVPILTEMAGKLQDKFKWDAEHVTEAVRHIAAVAVVLKPKKRLSVLADEPDNRVLECAAEAGAEVIVTGDKHLLKLDSYRGIGIITLAKFLENEPSS